MDDRPGGGPCTILIIRIVISDYGMGHRRGAPRALEAIGHPAAVTSDPDRVRAAEKVVLPASAPSPNCTASAWV